MLEGGQGEVVDVEPDSAPPVGCIVLCVVLVIQAAVLAQGSAYQYKY